MTTKYVHDTAAGKSISAWIILDPAGEHVATVRAFYGQSVLVNVWNHTREAQRRCAVARGTSEREAHDAYHFQYGRAGGWGYDKFAAALSGRIIDGHEMTDHCGGRHPLPEGMKLFPRDYPVPDGYSLANWDREGQGYMDCYRMEGLRYLSDIGYHVIPAI